SARVGALLESCGHAFMMAIYFSRFCGTFLPLTPHILIYLFSFVKGVSQKILGIFLISISYDQLCQGHNIEPDEVYKNSRTTTSTPVMGCWVLLIEA
ncbi:hypothetical protein, partial [Roseofilum sp. Guam]|uniref:hypothetical protein n=1 Tax=Roseofilum sp. Guam TaxID=2821502 RepID=UPI001AFF9791